MVGYVCIDDPGHVFDPAVGAGAFLRAAKTVASERNIALDLLGGELDPAALDEARRNGLAPSDLARIEINDFILNPPAARFKAIVANPPYIRHHRLSADLKGELKKISMEAMGTTLDGRAGLHIYFLIQALRSLDTNGRLAFIMPADTCEGVFAPKLWKWIAGNYRIDAVVTFAPDASPFPQVDTNPIIFMIAKAPSEDGLLWARCSQFGTDELKAWAASGFKSAIGDGLEVMNRDLAESLSTGLSRPPANESVSTVALGDFARVLRGIVTGANDFFFLTSVQAKKLGIPDDFLVQAIGRTRDVPGNEVTQQTIAELDAKGRPTLLFSPSGQPTYTFPHAVQEYIAKGKSAGIDAKPLVSTRRPWYKMETRTPPPILFTYLGRRNSRFILNTAGIVPLTSLLCIYPHQNDPELIERLWRALQHPDTISNLALVGKSYGSGAIKVEPRALEKLPIPDRAATSAGLDASAYAKQAGLW